MKETLYSFKMDKQGRITIPTAAKGVYEFERNVFIKLQVINEEKFLQISGKEIQFYQAVSTMDQKNRVFLTSAVKSKFELKPGDVFDSFEEEIDSDHRTLLLKKRIK